MNEERIAQLQKQLEAVRAKSSAVFAEKKREDWWNFMRALWHEETELERALSLEKGEETAVLLDWPYSWDTGAPIPHVVSDGWHTFLIYYLKEDDPNWDGTYAHVIDAASDKIYPVAVVQFDKCVNFRFGGVNHHDIDGHPLHDHGLQLYAAHRIINSKWLQFDENVNKNYESYSPNDWKDLNHYFFTFHDESFECLARGYQVEVTKGRFRDIVLETTKRLFRKL